MKDGPQRSDDSFQALGRPGSRWWLWGRPPTSTCDDEGRSRPETPAMTHPRRHPVQPVSQPRRRGRLLALLAGAWCSAGVWAADDPWPVAGQQGLLKVVIVPTAQATDMAAYKGQIASLCPGDRTCFVNFFTNSTGAPVALPLPDAIADEATARFRRSTKNGADLFQWSCRLKLGGECF